MAVLVPTKLTVPVLPPLNLNVDVPIVAESIASLKIAEITVSTATSVAPFDGFVELIVGGVVSTGVGIAVMVGVGVVTT